MTEVLHLALFDGYGLAALTICGRDRFDVPDHSPPPKGARTTATGNVLCPICYGRPQSHAHHPEETPTP